MRYAAVFSIAIVATACHPVDATEEWRNKGVFSRYGTKEVGDFYPDRPNEPLELIIPITPNHQVVKMMFSEDAYFHNAFDIKTIGTQLDQFIKGQSQTSDFPKDWAYKFALAEDRLSWQEYISATNTVQRDSFAHDYWQWLFGQPETRGKIDRLYKDREIWALEWWHQHLQSEKRNCIDPDWIQAALIDSNERNVAKFRSENQNLSNDQCKELNRIEVTERNFLNLRGKVYRVHRVKMLEYFRKEPKSESP